MDTDKLAAFLCGLIVGFILGSIGWAAAVYAFLTIKDWIRKRKEGSFKLGRNMKKALLRHSFHLTTIKRNILWQNLKTYNHSNSSKARRVR